MTVKINIINSSNSYEWDSYVYSNPKGTLYHLYEWKTIIEKTYSHDTYYLIAKKYIDQKITSPKHQNIKNMNQKRRNVFLDENPTRKVVGILPLVHLRHLFFGNSLISIPFFDFGGLLADDKNISKALLSEAMKLGERLKVERIELRQTEPIPNIAVLGTKQFKIKYEGSVGNWIIRNSQRKVLMFLKLPRSSEILLTSFRSKLRSQIKKPLKEGLYSRVGGLELLEDFYRVFLINMRDLGSPVHSKNLIRNVLDEFVDKSKIFIVYSNSKPLACSLTVGFKDILTNPWASALRKSSHLSPNMLLYWSMLSYACDNGYQYFNFGRSSPGGGTFKFKEQWGAKPIPLHWFYFSLDGQSMHTQDPEKSRFCKAIHYWQKLPVPVTKILGPQIRRHIGL
ncbi:MAG: GNAT family N-acetyltransferase [bacterium]